MRQGIRTTQDEVLMKRSKRQQQHQQKKQGVLEDEDAMDVSFGWMDETKDLSTDQEIVTTDGAGFSRMEAKKVLFSRNTK
jgi:hypothetical protein